MKNISICEKYAFYQRSIDLKLFINLQAFYFVLKLLENIYTRLTLPGFRGSTLGVRI